nr:tetraspanin-31 [Pelodiscus sinensis]|eukprot:XP_014424117.1 tetraspanin-31 [Pelodiscus sinensis]
MLDNCPLVGLLLIGVAAWGKSFGIPSTVGVFLLLIAIVGLIGAINHHQVMLFFYMVILGLVFLFQLGVSCSCLALNTSRQERLFTAAWNILGNSTRKDIEVKLNCCGLLNNTSDALAMQTFQADYSACKAVCKVNMTRCPKCGEKMLKHSDEALKILGGVGLFFSFTEILGVLLAMRYRNQKDPRANPSAFL